MLTLRSVAALAAVAMLSSVVPSDARPARVGQVPNGSALGCALCHVNPGGGGVRNAFGQMVENGFLTSNDFSGSVVWGPELAALDADGDGATNGEELQDPDGAWSAGDAAPGDVDLVTLTWDADSFPPPPPDATAVTASSWAGVKAAIRAIVD